MHSDLVGAARPGAYLHQTQRPRLGHHPVAGEGPLSLRVNPPLHGGGRIPADGLVHSPLRRTGRAQAQGQIGPAEALAVELAAQGVVGPAVLGRRQNPGGAPVQPVHQMHAGPRPQVVDQPLGQGGLLRREGGGDGGQAGRLIHHQQVLVLIEDLQRHGRRDQGGGTLRRVQIHPQPVPGPEEGRDEHPPAVDGEAGLGPLQAADAAGGEAQLPPQQALDRAPGLLLCHHQLQRRHGPPPFGKIPHISELYNSPRRFSICRFMQKSSGPGPSRRSRI